MYSESVSCRLAKEGQVKVQKAGRDIYMLDLFHLKEKEARHLGGRIASWDNASPPARGTK